MSDGPRGDLAEAVGVFFDRCELGLPVYVSKVPSMIVGAIAALLVVHAGMDVVRAERDKHRDSLVFALEYRWVSLLTALLGASFGVMKVVQDQVFLMAMIRANKQHFANTFWVREYARGFR